MTREEAIKKLKEQQNEFNEHCIDYAGINEAYNMAIKALKQQQSCENAISQKIDEFELNGKAITGIWIPLKQIGGIPIKDENNRQLYYCTSCGLLAFLGNYCSNCGSANQMEVTP